ncbi:ABC transporter ATP-binding protein [Amycolatopsis pithecellobii]|uniref:ATP-binding cassette domain-containing protein n=1 Tax=Amycolatopsis pithecellobii TaxID=664692 RepID=A0A6N7YUH2_9PSEU|nr:ABC transporter ATP-binding protein [Amycolatopsis pithecellobii]MTD52503.1 ATP-binding cassette domain-containing protein [Amycolatopsis pithecellobii]
MLCGKGLVAGYLGAPVLHEVSIDVRRGEVFCLLGANGAGKSTTAKCLAGALGLRGGRVTIDDVDVTAAGAHERVRRGVSLVPEARHLFGRSTVRDNIMLGGWTKSRSHRPASFERVLEMFPQLKRLLKSRARDLSGGEQQMVAIGRALMADPRYLILDEPSLGLAPIYVDAILRQAAELARQRVGILLIEQNVGKALSIGHRAAVVETGRVVLSGTAEEVAANPLVVDSYLGGAA